MQNDDVRVYTPPSGKQADATPTTLLCTNNSNIALGALDAAFARYPARVQLLLVVDAKIDEALARGGRTQQAIALDVGCSQEYVSQRKWILKARAQQPTT